MKRVLLFMLLLGMALAGSALEKGDFSYVVRQNPIMLGSEARQVTVDVLIDARKDVNAFNVTLEFLDHHDVITQEKKKMLDTVESIKRGTSIWQMSSKEEGAYDLSNAFEIVSWDDSVALQLGEIPSETSKSEIKINGTTDSAALCEKHNFVGFWGERGNCQVKITINDQEFWADKIGVINIDYELDEGENVLNIVAKDPGGNTKTEVRTTNYNKPVTEKYGTWILIAVVLVILIVLAFVLKKVLGIRKIVDEARQIAVDAVEKARVEDLLEAEKKLLLTYTRTGGSGAIIRELVPVWKKMIELSPELAALTGKESKDDISRVILSINPYLATLPAGVRMIILEQYIKLIKEKNKGGII